MLFPALFPDELAAYLSANSAEELLKLLIRKPADLVLFFETAADDETWSEEHSSLMGALMNWMTEQAYHGKLPLILSQRAVKAIRKHYQLLTPLLSENIEVQFQDTDMKVNSLLLGDLSEFFYTLILQQGRSTKEANVSLACKYASFIPFAVFMQTGKIPEINTLSYQELMVLLTQAKQWKVHEIVELCQKSLLKYIQRDNVADLLITAHKEGWEVVKKNCMLFINAYAVGFSLYAHATSRLGLAFTSFHGNALEAFEYFSKYVTDLSFPANLPNDQKCAQVLRQAPALVRLDLSQSDSIGVLMGQIPEQLKELDLSECLWIEVGVFKQLALTCPQLEQLSLCSDIQLKYMSWGELAHFACLKKLDLAYCRQIGDKELLIILKACPMVQELSLKECTGIDNEGFFNLGKYAPQLSYLKLSRCGIADSALVELGVHARSLVSLDLSRCTQITEKGVLQLLKLVPSLNELNLSGCGIPTHILDQIRRSYPSLALIIFSQG